MSIIKKILVVNIATEFGGAEKSIVDVFKHINHREDYELLFLVENSKLQNLLKKNNIKHKVIKVGKIKKDTLGIIKLIKGSYKVFKEILKYKPDIVFTNTDISHIIGGIASIFTFTPFVWVLRDYHFNNIAKKIIEPFVYRVICVSEHIKNFYKNKKYSKKYCIIPNGIDLHNVKDNYSLIYRNQYAKGQKTIIYGIASRFVKWKGIDNLIKAFSLASNKVQLFDAKLLIAGIAEEGSEEYYYLQELKSIVRKLGLEEKIQFIGWVDNVLEFFYNCDVIVSSSTTKNGGPESFGRTIIEAWSVKKPVITTDCGGPKYIIENGKTGLKVKENSVEDLSFAIIKLYNDLIVRKRIGEEGFKKIKSFYNINKISKMYENVIDEVSM